MNKSESIKNIAAALMAFNTEMAVIHKTADNPFFKSKYAPLNEILKAIQPALKNAGLVLTQFPDGEGLGTILMHPQSGEWISGVVKMELEKVTPQGYGSASTYYRRYSLASVLMLNIEDDDDGNKAETPKAEAPSLPWLNEGTQEFIQAKNIIQAATDKNAAFKALRAKYAISKKVAEALK